ncbi:MAG TPA: hypothetical protein VKB92_00850 [Myxococcales bacterium]|nr:hypothetical protein [Myxococcales bacterium]
MNRTPPDGALRVEGAAFIRSPPQMCAHGGPQMCARGGPQMCARDGPQMCARGRSQGMRP